MDTDVVVIGAGAAGLAAAAEQSVRVVVCEGRDRIGGRVRWQSVGSVDAPVELGAEFIHGEAPETSALLREAGLRRVDIGEVSWICNSDGVLAPADDNASLS
jgi:monoamine oxidase